MPEYTILQLSYVKIPFLFTSEEDLRNSIIYYAGRAINYIAGQSGYQLISVTPPFPDEGLPCISSPCVLLWFRKTPTAYPALTRVEDIIDAITSHVSGILITFVAQLTYNEETKKALLITSYELGSTSLYEMCVNQGVSPDVCSTIAENIAQGKSTEFSILQIHYVPIPYVFPGEEEVINRINGAGDLINNTSLQFGYQFVGAYPANEAAPCQGPLPTPCINLWFLKKGSPGLPIAAILALLAGAIILGIIAYYIVELIYKIEKNRAEQLKDMLQNANNMFNSCLNQGGSPETCSQIVSNIVHGTKISASPVEEFGNLVRTIGVLVAVGIGGFILIEVLRMWRRG